MAVAYFDCFAGAAGDMILAALLDAGCDFDALSDGLDKLDLPGYSPRRERVHRGGIAGVRFHVDVEETDHPHRHLADILHMIDAAGLPGRAASRARAVFQRLGEAEAKVHDCTVEEIHFHEVGAVDSIVDIVGACIALDLLGVDRVSCSGIPTGSGTVRCEHGLLPVPAPATAELLRGVPIRAAEVEGESTTPTGAAVLTTLAESFGPMPEMSVSAVGYGAGAREGDAIPNLLRVVLGEPSAGDADADTVVELAANVDDATGEVLGATIDKLLAAGCADAWATPILMKKSRPAWMLSALCAPADVEAVETILFSETTTFGVRRQMHRRSKLRRSHETVETPYGPIRVKIGRRGDETVTASPEFAECLAAAEAHHVSAREVLAAAQDAWRASRRA